MSETRNGRTHPKCPRCGVVWRQSGNATGHCSGCHATFDSLSAFERHRVDGPDDSRICRDLAAAVNSDGTLMFESRFTDGVTYWRLRPSQAEVERLAALAAGQPRVRASAA